MFVIIVFFSYINTLQDSAETHIWCGWIYDN